MIETKALIDTALHHKPPFFCSICCVTNHAAHQIVVNWWFITSSLLQAEAKQSEHIQNGSLKHTCLQQRWDIVINCMLPRCPNNHGLWESLTYNYLCCPVLWSHCIAQKRTISAMKPSKATKTLGESISSDSLDNLQVSAAPMALMDASCFCHMKSSYWFR